MTKAILKFIERREVTVVLLSVVVCFSLGVRLVDIHRSLWLDELHTSWTVNEGWQNVSDRAKSGNQAPFYFYVVRGVVAFLGHSEFSLRILSVFAGTGVCILGFVFTRSITHSSVAALFVALLMSIDPYLIEYSQEARPYSFLQLAALIQIALFARRFLATQLETNQIDHSVSANAAAKWDRVGLILITATCFYIHFTAVLLTASLFLIVVGWNAFRGEAWSLNKLGLPGDLIAGMLLCLPNLVTIQEILSRKGNWELFINDLFWTPSIVYQGWVYALPGFLALSGWWFAKRNDESANNVAKLVLILFFAYLLTILLAWLAYKSKVAALYHQRYFMIGWPGIILSAVMSIFLATNSLMRSSRLVGWTAAIAVLACSVALNTVTWNAVFRGRMPFESGWREALSLLTKDAEGRGSLYVFPNLIEDRLLPLGDESAELAEYCLFPVTSLYSSGTAIQIPKPTLSRPRFGEGDRLEMIKSGRIYLLIRGDQRLIGDILNEFAEFGINHQLFVKSRSSQAVEIRGAPNQFIAWFSFDVTDEREETPSLGDSEQRHRTD